MEELSKEEVAVLLIVVGTYLERCELLASLRRYARSRRLLLRSYKLQFQSAELQVGTQSEQRRGSLHQRRVGGERHVASLNELNNLVFLALILQLHVLGVEVERSVGVVVEVHVHLVAHTSVDVDIYLLIKVHGRGLAVADGKRRIVDVLHRGSELQLGCTLCTYAHTAGTEYLLSRTQVEVHVAEVELLLAFGLIYLVVLLAEEVAHKLALAPLHILLSGHHHGSSNVRSANLLTDYILAKRVVVLHLLLHIVGALQVGGALMEVVERDGQRALYAPAWMQQRVGYGVVVGYKRLRLDGERVGTRLVDVATLRTLRHGKSSHSRHNEYDDYRSGGQGQCQPFA